MPQQRLGMAYPAVVIHSGGGRGAQVPKLELRLGNAGGIPRGVEAVAEHVLCQRLTRLVHKQLRGVRFDLDFVRLDLGQQLLKCACYLDAQLGCLALADVEHAAGNVVGAHAKHVGRALASEERQVDSEPQGYCSLLQQPSHQVVADYDIPPILPEASHACAGVGGLREALIPGKVPHARRDFSRLARTWPTESGIV